ncbi:MAG: hypothetical protein AUK47_05960 [Deltaproteobacteria bacterium CG2_30_63_29]|nr:MAG: hypothetical protein AUK47_05960 [Deltaproteobacteria bacterium CG2_30_63_29]PIW02552.1 MAG: hypothetical protein COW42_01035 [Deltaproteobacteria bacterium CG17_big_fil_post_rev_8_21_14_2_50_63_7]PJB38599.1 MAG: hypothetical protein CO108_18640 [Deltaproteobacteria bacterium CG_4_9_14_3_um_filter_63_12]
MGATTLTGSEGQVQTLKLGANTFKRPNPMPVATILFSAAAGGLGFGMFRLLLVAGFRDAMAWNIIWEEFTELLFVLGAAWVLWTFSRSWRQKRAKAGETPQPFEG